MNEIDLFSRQHADAARLMEQLRGHYIQTLITTERCECGEAEISRELVVENTHAVVWRACVLCAVKKLEEGVMT